MSRKLLAFLLSELRTVRIVCKGCAAVLEVPIEKLGNSVATCECKVCGQSFPRLKDAENRGPFWQLGQAIQQFRTHEAVVDIEFILPDDSGD